MAVRWVSCLCVTCMLLTVVKCRALRLFAKTCHFFSLMWSVVFQLCIFHQPWWAMSPHYEHPACAPARIVVVPVHGRALSPKHSARLWYAENYRVTTPRQPSIQPPARVNSPSNWKHSTGRGPSTDYSHATLNRDSRLSHT